MCWSQDPTNRPYMKQCVEWSSCEEFDRLRTEITLGSCHSIACACVSRVEPSLESEWIEEDTLKTEMDGSLFTKEEMDRFQLSDKLLSEATESVIEKQIDNPLTNSTEDELTESSDSINDDELISSNSSGFKRRDSIYVTSASLEVAKDLAKKLLRKKEYRGPKNSSQARSKGAQHSVVETSYSQIWMCGRDKKKGLLAAFILPDNEKNIFVSEHHNIHHYMYIYYTCRDMYHIHVHVLICTTYIHVLYCRYCIMHISTHLLIMSYCYFFSFIAFLWLCW